MRFEKSCGAVVYKYANGRYYFLLIKHKNGGHWDFPKGHVEVGESDEETAKREVYEETGLLVKLHEGFREIIEYSPKKGVSKKVVFFLGTAENGEIKCQAEEIEDFGWLDFENANKRLTFDSAKEILKKAKGILE